MAAHGAEDRDIGGPAHVITLGVEALRGTMDNDRGSEASWLIQSVSRNSRYLGDLVQHFLEYSRLRSGRYQLNPAEMSVVAVMERWGFTWGGRWLVPDPSYFEYLRPP